MKFEEVMFEYEKTFGEHPPILTTLDVNDELYLDMLKDAINKNEPITKNDLAKVFMTDKNVKY